MLQKKEKWIITGVIALMSIIVFINLGKGEIQPWDEGLYAIRAKSILHFNDFWDQTLYSSGGLYSSTYPPLTIWFMSGAMSVFGENGFSVRFFTVLCSIASLIFIYLISKRIVSFKYSLLAVILTGSTYVWDKFSREGMTDIPLTFFFILTFWAVIKLRESDEKKKIIFYSIIFALGFASALMTKIIISFLPLLFVFLLSFEKNNKKWYLLLASIIAISLASPWYIYMIIQYGAPFYKALFVPHIYSVVETNSPKLGPFYYLNQLLVSNPFVLFTFVLIILLISKNIRNSIIEKIRTDYVLYASVLWFGIIFIILSIARTKMLHYSVYMVPPAILISVIFIENMKLFIKNYRLIWLLFLSIIIFTVWSFSNGIRQDIKLIFTAYHFSTNALVLISLITISLCAVIFIKGKIIQNLTDKFSTAFIFVCSLMLITNIIVLNSFYTLGHSYGAEKAAGYVLKSNENSFIYLYHEATSSESLNPQLAWYTMGIMNNWIEGKKCKTYPLPLNANISDTLEKMKSLKENIVIYYKPKEEEFAKVVCDKVSKEWHKVDFCDRYIVFRRRD
ncbi:MAG: hypothetical protein EPN82_08950 [Bacteroidetes bacterium]|nr:MAG: hypothetical protein EPN82_08950 [Bacteroidota bacterium]